LYLIGTLDRPTSGRIAIEGADPFQLDEPRLADFRNERIGFVFQDHHLLPQCSVLENVLLPTIAQRRTTGKANDTQRSGSNGKAIERAKMLIDRVGLSDRIDHRPAELSGGERQRVAVARALICEPALLLADEPTGNLDRSTAASIGKLLVELQRESSTMMIAVTHSLELAGMFDRQLELDGGRLKPRE
jgi:lipoprotein-releasing system ATP-binding protein